MDSANRFYSLVPEQLLIPGLVIPADCTVQRLLKYSCMENIQYGKRSYTKHRTGTMTDKTMGAEITIQTLVLCNACNLETESSSQNGYKSDFDPFIDQQQIATIITNSGIDFSVQAFEVKEERRRTKGRSRGRKTGSKGGSTKTMNNSKVFCNGRILSYTTASSMQCGK